MVKLSLVPTDHLTTSDRLWLAYGVVVSLAFIASGALWCFAPGIFVSLHGGMLRRLKPAKVAAWKSSVRSTSGRVVGAFLCAFGVYILWKVISLIESR